MQITIDIPRIETERLILRENRREDFPAMVEIWTDPVVRKHFHGPALTREDLWSRYLRSFGMWAVTGYGTWAVEEKESGAYIGTVGLFEVMRDIDPPLENMPEAGWTLATRAHGKGYATEAAVAALAWADAKLDYPDMFALLAPANKGSIRVAEKCGFRPWYETVYQTAPTLVYRRGGKTP